MLPVYIIERASFILESYKFNNLTNCQNSSL